MKKEETTLKVFRNTAVDDFLKRVWKNKRFQNLTAEVFWWKSWAGMKVWNPMADRHFALVQFMPQLPLLRDHSSSQTQAGALQCQHPPTAFPPHSVEQNGNSPQFSREESCSHTSACDWAAGIRARSPRCPHQVSAAESSRHTLATWLLTSEVLGHVLTRETKA